MFSLFEVPSADQKILLQLLDLSLQGKSGLNPWPEFAITSTFKNAAESIVGCAGTAACRIDGVLGVPGVLRAFACSDR